MKFVIPSKRRILTNILVPFEIDDLFGPKMSWHYFTFNFHMGQ